MALPCLAIYEIATHNGFKRLTKGNGGHRQENPLSASPTLAVGGGADVGVKFPQGGVCNLRGISPSRNSDGYKLAGVGVFTESTVHMWIRWPFSPFFRICARTRPWCGGDELGTITLPKAAVGTHERVAARPYGTHSSEHVSELRRKASCMAAMRHA